MKAILLKTTNIAIFFGLISLLVSPSLLHAACPDKDDATAAITAYLADNNVSEFKSIGRSWKIVSASEPHPAKTPYNLTLKDKGRTCDVNIEGNADLHEAFIMDKAVITLVKRTLPK